jgi:hypothetical protein
VAGSPDIIPETEVDTTETLNDSVFSTSGSSIISNSTSLGPVSPGLNVTLTVLETKSLSLAEAGLVSNLK